MTSPRIRRALISVHDKRALEDFARGLSDRGVEIVATSGTAMYLKKFVPVWDSTLFFKSPEILQGQVKTLNLKIFGSILADPLEDSEEIRDYHLTLVDLVVVNFKPFDDSTPSTLEEAKKRLKQLDIGGPALIRAAVKNMNRVLPVVCPNDYYVLLSEMDVHQGWVSDDFQLKLSITALKHMTQYDNVIAERLLHVRNKRNAEMKASA